MTALGNGAHFRLWALSGRCEAPSGMPLACRTLLLEIPVSAYWQAIVC